MEETLPRRCILSIKEQNPPKRKKCLREEAFLASKNKNIEEEDPSRRKRRFREEVFFFLSRRRSI